MALSCVNAITVNCFNQYTYVKCSSTAWHISVKSISDQWLVIGRFWHIIGIGKTQNSHIGAPLFRISTCLAYLMLCVL